MTENKRFGYNVNKNSIEYDGKHFAYCNGQQSKITNKLNELHEEKEILQKRLDNTVNLTARVQVRNDKLKEENEQLKHCIKKLQNDLNNCEEDYILEEYL